MNDRSHISIPPDFDRLRGPIDAALTQATAFGPGCPAQLMEAVRYSLLSPGKRLRPVLALLAAEACGGSIETAMPAACAVEMVHAYSLIHDDLPAMDNDDMRRGRPTCHRVFGEAVAILAGDSLLTLAFETLATGIRPAENAARCCAALAAAAGACQLVGGQADDIDGASPNSTVADLESIHHRKTGAMIGVSLRLGAMAVGANDASLAALDSYGRGLGLAFQITDDLLDVGGTEAAAGKRLGKDASHGKLTFPSLIGVESSEAYAHECVTKACDALEPFEERARPLIALAQFVLERNC